MVGCKLLTVYVYFYLIPTFQIAREGHSPIIMSSEGVTKDDIIALPPLTLEGIMFTQIQDTIFVQIPGKNTNIIYIIIFLFKQKDVTCN